ncbi:MAG: hypothetical protein QNJ98_17705 [Planctomycetota bacterium]|nr:hypothetical protein [Planctomycetota bacterium]
MRKMLGISAALAVVAVAAVCFNGAFAGEEVPAKAAPKTDAPETPAVVVKTKTASPMDSMMGWVSEQIKTTKGAEGSCCGAMKAWFAGGKDVPLAGMRDRLVADGWTADSTIAFMKKMKAAKSADCGGCDKASDCGGCDKAGDCSGCDKAKDCCGGCDKAGECGGDKECCGGCDKKQPDPTKPPAKTDIGS